MELECRLSTNMQNSETKQPFFKVAILRMKGAFWLPSKRAVSRFQGATAPPSLDDLHYESSGAAKKNKRTFPYMAPFYVQALHVLVQRDYSSSSEGLRYQLTTLIFSPFLFHINPQAEAVLPKNSIIPKLFVPFDREVPTKVTERQMNLHGPRLVDLKAGLARFGQLFSPTAATQDRKFLSQRNLTVSLPISAPQIHRRAFSRFCFLL